MIPQDRPLGPEQTQNQIITLQPIQSVTLFRQQHTPTTFQEQLLVYIARRRLAAVPQDVVKTYPIFMVREMPSQKSNNDYLPIVVINNKYTIDEPHRIEKLCLNLYENNELPVYLDRLAVLDLCKKLISYQVNKENTDRTSKNWMFLSPFKRLHDYFEYSKTKAILLKQLGIRQQKNDDIKKANTQGFDKYLEIIQKYAQATDSFCKDCLYVCFSYLLAKKNELSEMVNRKVAITKFLRQFSRGVGDSTRQQIRRMITRQGGFLYPVMSSQKQEHTEAKKQRRPKELSAGLAWTAAIMAAVWIPYIIVETEA